MTHTAMTAWRLVPVFAATLLAVAGAAAEQQKFPLDLKITLSEKAAHKLKTTKEALAIWASYQGEPKPGAEKHAGEDGQIDLGGENLVVPGEPGVAHLTGGFVKHERLQWVRGPANINVNISSARKSSADNILNCDFIDGDLTKLTGREIALHCALIEENYENRLVDR